MDFIPALSVFAMACLAGYFAVRRANSALHIPLLALLTALGGVIIVGALMVRAEASGDKPGYLALIGVALSAIGLVGGFGVAQRLLAASRRGDGE